MAGFGQVQAGILRGAEAPPESRAVLDQVQDAMGLPWLPFTWAAYARRPAVLKLFWDRLEAVTGNDLFLREALAIAGSVHMGASPWYRPAESMRLASITREPPSLFRELDAFEIGLPQLFIQQLALARLLGGHGVGRDGRTVPRRGGGGRRPEIDFPAWEDLAPPARAAARHIRHAWSLPQAVPELLALAKWPDFLEHAWEEIKVWRLRPEYQTLRRKVSDLGEDALERLRPGTTLASAELRAALEQGEEGPEAMDRVRDQVLSFTLILPGMVVDVSLLRLAAAAWREKPAPGRGRP